MTASKDKAKKLFQVNPLLMGDKFNCRRQFRLPYAVIANKENCGIIIPTEQIRRAFWINPPEQIEKVQIGGTVLEGYFLTAARMSVIGYSPEFICWKGDDDDEKGIENPKQFIALTHEFDSSQFDKDKMDRIQYYMVYFMSEDNKCLHKFPYRLKVKNTALTDFRDSLATFYQVGEMCFSENIEGVDYSQKSDEWRACLVFNVTFFSEYKGEGKNQTAVLQSRNFTMPNTVEALAELFVNDDETIRKLQGAVKTFILPHPDPAKRLPSGSTDIPDYEDEPATNGKSKSQDKDDVPF